MNEITKNGNRQIARAAGVVMFAFGLSNVFGLIRQILVSREFGTSAELDAFNAASTYPDLIFSLVAGGALASAFIPTLTTFLTKNDREGGWYLSSVIINLVFVILGTISFLSILAAPWIVSTVLAPSYSPEMQALTVSILRILLIAPTIFGISGIFMGILNAHQSFIWPALAPSMLWIGMILGVVFLAPWIGIYGLAWGYVLGAFLHLLIQLPAILRQAGRRYFFTIDIHFAAVREVGRLMGPRLLGVAAVQINFVVNTILATGMVVGSLASIKYAWAIMTMPQVIIAQSIAIAALPTFSTQVASGKIEEMRSSLAATLRGVIILSIPAMVGLIILRKPIIAALFQRGAFTVDSTELVAWALLWYAIGLLGHGGVEILSRAFYSMHDTKTPVLISIGAMGLNVVLSLLFVQLFERIGWWPFGGLALANSLATALEMVVLWTLMSKRIDGIDGGLIWKGFLQSSLGSLVMGCGLIIWINLSQGYPAWVIGIGGVLIGAGIYMVMAYFVRMKEVAQLVSIVRQKTS